MSDLTTTRGGQAATMTSLEIAELVDSRHDKVKQSIERLAERGVISLPPMGEVKIQRERREETVKVYLFEGEQGKRDSIVVVAQLSPEFTARLVDRWRELEGKLQALEATALPSYPDALRQLADTLDQNARITAERDQAVATKALIGSKREASAMATASAAVRQVRQLENELGRGCEQATVTAVEGATHQKFGKQGFRPLQAWCKSHGIQPNHVQDPRYGHVCAWPAAAWADVYQIDLRALFGAEGETA